MSYSKQLKCAAAIAGMTIATVALADPPPSGVTPTTFVTSTLAEDVKANNDRIKFQTKDPTDIRVQRLEFAAGGSTGWHHHPGLVVVVVNTGTLTLWESDCSQTTYGPGLPAGAVFIEAEPHSHQATSTGGADVYVTYVVPAGAGFRNEEPIPFCATSF